MRYSTLFDEIIKVLNRDGVKTYYYDSETAQKITLWDEMYRDCPQWVDNVKTFSLNLPAAISAELARLSTVEMSTNIKGSAFAIWLDNLYQNDVVRNLRKYLEYGLAKGNIVIKPIPTKDGIRTQFIQAGNFFPIEYDNNGKITKCVFTEQIKRLNSIYTLLEIHTLNGERLTIENRAFRSSDGLRLGAETSLADVEEWQSLSEKVTLSGTDSLLFGLFSCPLANQIDSNSPLGVSAYSRAVKLIEEADRRYSDICWEYEAKQAAVHMSSSMMTKDCNGNWKVPEDRERLYRVVEYNTGAVDKPLIDVYSPEIRDSSLFNGLNQQLRRIEFNCNVAYGTLSDPNNVEKTAEEIKTSKKRSFDFVNNIHTEIEKTIEDWAKAVWFWSQIYGLAPNGDYSIDFNWGDGILYDEEDERKNDRADLANGTLRPEEYRAKYRNETIEEALKNLPQTADVIE